MNFHFTTFLFALLSTFLALVGALPLTKRDVYVPPVLYPHAGTVWYVGQTHNVTWDVSNPPAQITNKIGQIVLAKGGIQDYQHPLAGNFSILDGRHEITVPNVEPGDDYAIVLFGDSGNYGQNFTISA